MARCNFTVTCNLKTLRDKLQKPSRVWHPFFFENCLLLFAALRDKLLQRCTWSRPLFSPCWRYGTQPFVALQVFCFCFATCRTKFPICKLQKNWCRKTCKTGSRVIVHSPEAPSISLFVPALTMGIASGRSRGKNFAVGVVHPVASTRGPERTILTTHALIG